MNSSSEVEFRSDKRFQTLRLNSFHYLSCEIRLENTFIAFMMQKTLFIGTRTSEPLQVLMGNYETACGSIEHKSTF